MVNSRTSIITVEGLAKTFMVGFFRNRKKHVLHDVTFSVKQGDIYGFLGPNGAGKTTTLSLLLGLLKPERGTVTIMGQSRHTLERRHIGYAPDNTIYYEHLTGRENAIFAGILGGLNRAQAKRKADELFEKVGLQFAQTTYVRQYSHGMKKRLGIIISLMNNPAILFRDEPMNGLDPLGRTLIKNLMQELQQQGKTILFSTHILPDVQQVASSYGILHKGSIIDTGEVSSITGSLEDRFVNKIEEHTNTHTAHSDQTKRHIQ